MNKSTLIASILATATLAACAGAPINHDAARAMAERQCRVTAATEKQYPIDAQGNVRLVNVAYAKCMQAKGFGPREG